MSSASRRLPFLWGALALALLVVLIRQAPGISSVLLGASILAYVCAPAVDRLARRMPRGAATALVMFGLFVMIAGMLLMLVPVLVNQWRHLSERLPAIVDYIEKEVPDLATRLGVQIPTDQGEVLEKVRGALATSGSRIASAAGQFAGKTFGGVMGVAGTVISFVVIMPMLAFYILLNYHATWPYVLGLIPPRHAASVTEIKTEIDASLGGFVRGQLTVALVVGSIFAIGLSIVGIEGGIVVGLINGFMNMIPLVGSIFSITLSLTLALLMFQGWHPVAGVLIVYAVEAVLENTLITPRIIGHKVGLPPFAVLLSVLGFGELFGFVGTLLAVPMAAVIKVLIMHARRSYFASEGYQAGSAGTVALPAAAAPGGAPPPPAPRLIPPAASHPTDGD